MTEHDPVSALVKRLIAKLEKLPPDDRRRLVCTANHVKRER